MILELAKLFIKAEEVDNFIAILPKVEAVISQAKGFESIAFKRSVENSNTFVAFITWATLEDHTVGFRESELFLEWRATISPYFASTPEVEHFSIA